MVVRIRKKLLIIVLFIFIFIGTPKVEAKTTITMCDSGCDYSNFFSVYMDYKNDTITDLDLEIEIVGILSDSDNLIELLSILNSLTIYGSSNGNAEISDFSVNNKSNTVKNFSIKNINLSIVEPVAFFKLEKFNNITMQNVNINLDKYIDNQYLENIYLNANNVIIDNVTLNSNCDLNVSLPLDMYNGFAISGVNDLSINNLTINNHGYKFTSGLLLEDVKKGTINNLTINNSVIGLYVHMIEENNVSSNIEVNNSNLLDNTCSSFNVLDNNYMTGGVIPLSNFDSSLPFSSNKNYQVRFNDNNSLNCAVASGKDINTYVSGNNTWSSDPTSYFYDEINYGKLTDTVQNVNNGTVDVAKKYKGKVTIEKGSSSAIENAFADNIDLSNNIIWNSDDDAISRIDNG